VVFTATTEQESGVFVGLSDPSFVRWSLAIAYPWLEAAFARAYAQVSPERPPSGTTFVVSREGALQPLLANNLVRAFLTDIQYPPAVPVQPAQSASPVASPQPLGDWIELPRPIPTERQVWERATWLTPSLLLQVLGREALDRDSSFEDSPDLSTAERARGIARRAGAFIALVTRTGQFKALADRQALLEVIAHTYSEPK